MPGLVILLLHFLQHHASYISMLYWAAACIRKELPPAFRYLLVSSLFCYALYWSSWLYFKGAHDEVSRFVFKLWFTFSFERL